MDNLQHLFQMHVGKSKPKTKNISESNSETMMGRFLDGDRELRQDATSTPGVEETQEAEIPAEEYVDPAMDPNMSPEFASMAPVNMVDPDISSTQKHLNLLDLFLTLKQQTEKMEKAWNEFDFNMIEDEHRKDTMIRKENILNLKDKLIKYITDNFKYESYEKSLYVYHLLRTDLILILKWFNALVKKYPIEEKTDK